MTWTIINGLSSVIVAIILTYKLARFYDNFILLERLGMGMLGAGMVLNIAPILNGAGTPFHCHEATPFDDWGSTMIRVGIALYFIGRLIRNLRHRRANDAQHRIADAHFGGKGCRDR